MLLDLASDGESPLVTIGKPWSLSLISLQASVTRGDGGGGGGPWSISPELRQSLSASLIVLKSFARVRLLQSTGLGSPGCRRMTICDSASELRPLGATGRAVGKALRYCGTEPNAALPFFGCLFLPFIQTLFLSSLFVVMQMAESEITTISEANDLADSLEGGCLQVTKERSGPRAVEGDQCNLAKWAD